MVIFMYFFVYISSFFCMYISFIFIFIFSSAQSFCSNWKSYPSIYSSPSSSGTSPQSGEISKSCSKDRSTHWDKYSICTCCLWRKYGHVCAFACKKSFSVSPPSPPQLLHAHKYMKKSDCECCRFFSSTPNLWVLLALGVAVQRATRK